MFIKIVLKNDIYLKIITMGRPKLTETKKKSSISLSFSPEIHKLIKDVRNKSEFMEKLIMEHYNNKKDKK